MAQLAALVLPDGILGTHQESSDLIYLRPMKPEAGPCDLRPDKPYGN